ncbi:MAG: amidohydrolase family protein [Gammaproteobacteria bacterium]|nr:amidohydrolase family protein [Gammaproteobacteria bacterium]
MDVEVLITGARAPTGKEPLSLGIVGERIAHLGDGEGVRAGRVIDAQGCLLLPGLVEPHAHLDKTYSVAALPAGPASAQGALREAIAAMGQHKAERSIDEMLERADAALKRATACGVSTLRSHVDVGAPADLDNLRALLDLGRAHRHRIALRLTVLSDPGSRDGFALSREALALGADAIGGAPALTADPQRSISASFDLAEASGCAIDLHIDENEDPRSPCLEQLADEARRRRWQGDLCASHCCALGFARKSDRDRIIGKVAEAGIDIVALPACNLFLMGRGQEPVPRGIAPVNALQEAGVNVCVGTDNVQDPFHALGDYDPLANAALLFNAAHFGGRDVGRALRLATDNAAQALDLGDGYGLQAGALANFSLYRCDGPLAALTERPLRSWVFFRGRPILRQSLAQHWLVGDGR